MSSTQGSDSGLECAIKWQLRQLGILFGWKNVKLLYKKYIKALAKDAEPLALRLDSVYNPDLELPNGILIETKGRFTVADAAKHLLVRIQHPSRDIRFVFEDSTRLMDNDRNLSYGKWCEKNGFLYADELIPAAWLE